jgi:uracil-DNA glycosylase family 4
MNNLFAFTPKDKLSIPLLPLCGKCGLYRNCHSPKMPVWGKGKKGIFILGEAPGQNEDREGKPFIGRAGEKLRGTLERYGVDADEDCWIYNSLICHPKDKDGNNRKPTPKEINFCRPNVVRTIKELKPRVIIPLGEVAVKSLLGWLWRPKVGAISRWVDWQIPDRQLDAWICPNYHPSWVLRQGGETDEVKDLLFREALKKAVELEGRPGPAPENYVDEVQIIMNPKMVAYMIPCMGYSSFDSPVAFDYETDQLKPDGNGEIICCSMSDGLTTMVFPWHGKQVKEAMKKFLESPIPKVGQNIKFEHRWSKKELDCDVNNWIHDDMTTAHVLDNKRGITGIEFQAYVLLGQTPWDYDVHEFLKAKGSTKKNRIRECDLRSLLLYCGIDSLIEWHVAQIQMKKLKGEMKCPTTSTVNQRR